MMFTIGPRNFFHHNPTVRAVNPTHGMNKKYQKTPEWYMLKSSLRKSIVSWPWMIASGTYCFIAFPRFDLYLYFWLTSDDFVKSSFSKNKMLVIQCPIQYCFEEHVFSLFICISLVEINRYYRGENMLLLFYFLFFLTFLNESFIYYFYGLPTNFFIEPFCNIPDRMWG